jgi:phosphoribosylanthranilate isomerase
MKTIAIKICGITNLEDGLAALQSGANLLGFNFYSPSPRCLTEDTCTRLVADLRASGHPFQAVGVFVNHSPQQIESLLDRCGLDLAQLSGDEPAYTLEALTGRAFKALRPVNAAALDQELNKYPARTSEPAYLVDAYQQGEYGGTGQVADWSLASGFAKRHPILLAGGLKPENVAEAVCQVRPWGVDVASGVEAYPGRKDPAKIAAFVQACLTAIESSANHPMNIEEQVHVERSIN